MWSHPHARHVSHTPAACSFPGENARSWEALGEARPGQSSLSAGALRYRVFSSRDISLLPFHGTARVSLASSSPRDYGRMLL